MSCLTVHAPTVDITGITIPDVGLTMGFYGFPDAYFQPQIMPWTILMLAVTSGLLVYGSYAYWFIGKRDWYRCSAYLWFLTNVILIFTIPFTPFIYKFMLNLMWLNDVGHVMITYIIVWSLLYKISLTHLVDVYPVKLVATFTNPIDYLYETTDRKYLLRFYVGFEIVVLFTQWVIINLPGEIDPYSFGALGISIYHDVLHLIVAALTIHYYGFSDWYGLSMILSIGFHWCITISFLIGCGTNEGGSVLGLFFMVLSATSQVAILR